MAWIKWLSEISHDDIELVGRNCYDLSLLYKARLPVANGFCITKKGFLEFLSKSGIKSKVENLLSQANAESKDALDVVSGEIKKLIVSSEMIPEMKREISEAYGNMSISSELHGLVNTGAISLIKAGRDTPYTMISNSFNENAIGQNVCLNSVKGLENILLALKKCWADSINAENLYRLLKNDVKEGAIYPGIMIQKMVNSSRAGVVYLNEDKIVIKAHWGLYGLMDLEKVKPDVYIVEDSELAIKDIEINNQAYAFVRDDNLGQTVKREIPLSRRSVQILSEAEVKRLAKVAGEISSIIGENKMLEWGVDEGRLFITAVKPLTRTETYQDEVYDENNLTERLDTITEVSLNITEIDDNMNVSRADGVGMVESMLVQNKDEFFYYIRDDMEDAAVNGIADKLVRIAGSFSKGNVWYKLIDRPEKFYDWRYELEKEGREEVLIGLEIAAIKKARDNGFKNIGILIPLVNDAEKVRNMKALLRKAGLQPGEDIMLGLLVDNPASVQMLNEILQEKINYISIDVNRLARYSLAVKKADEVNVMHPAVIKQIKMIVDAAGKQGIKTGVCNFNASLDLVELFVKLGIDNLTVNNDDLELIRKSVAKVEKRLLLGVARDAYKKSLQKEHL